MFFVRFIGSYKGDQKISPNTELQIIA